MLKALIANLGTGTGRLSPRNSLQHQEHGASCTSDDLSQAVHGLNGPIWQDSKVKAAYKLCKPCHSRSLHNPTSPLAVQAIKPPSMGVGQAFLQIVVDDLQAHIWPSLERQTTEIFFSCDAATQHTSAIPLAQCFASPSTHQINLPSPGVAAVVSIALLPMLPILPVLLRLHERVALCPQNHKFV